LRDLVCGAQPTERGARGRPAAPGTGARGTGRCAAPVRNADPAPGRSGTAGRGRRGAGGGGASPDESQNVTDPLSAFPRLLEAGGDLESVPQARHAVEALV